ncbi:DUF2975 domain-containing protein [Candidatus Saccharibacteria bacterium]|nr:DUF2975 domain-containing protein [Candidatus Saccharibacteria bacterium]
MQIKPLINQYKINLSTSFLQLITLLVGIVTIIILIWEPQVEGVNQTATNFEIYLQDPFLALVYLGSIPFFVSIYQAYRLLDYVKQGRVLSTKSLDVLRIIKRCFQIIIGTIILLEMIILISPSDDHTGGVMIGIMISIVSLIIISLAIILSSIIQHITSQN